MELDLVSPENLLLGIAHPFATQTEVYRTMREYGFSRCRGGRWDDGVEVVVAAGGHARGQFLTVARNQW